MVTVLADLEWNLTNIHCARAGLKARLYYSGTLQLSKLEPMLLWWNLL